MQRSVVHHRWLVGLPKLALVSLLGFVSLRVTPASAAPASAASATTDISVTLAADGNTAKVGQNITFTARASNLGPDDATFVDFAFQVPDQFVVVSMSCDLGISPDGQFCEYSSLPSGATVVSTLVVTPKAAGQTRSRIVTTSVATLFENAGALDPNLANNTASVKTKIIGRLTQP